MKNAMPRCTPAAQLGLAFLLLWAIRLQGAQAPGNAPVPKQEQVAERDRLIRQVEGLRAAGKFDEAIPIAEHVLELEQQSGVGTTARTAEAFSRLGELCELRGKWDKALGCRQQALTARSGVDGKDHWRTADARLALAFTKRVAGFAQPDQARVQMALRNELEAARLGAQGQHAGAEQAARTAYETYRSVFGPDSVEAARALHAIGAIRLQTGDARGAKEPNEQALAIRRKALPRDHPDIALSLNSLGFAQVQLHDYMAAKACHEEALTIYRAAKDLLNTAYSLECVGWLQQNVQEFGAAKASYSEALAIRRKALPPAHPTLAWTLSNLGQAQAGLRELAAAKASYGEAVTIYRAAKDEPSIASSVANLGWVAYELREYAAAKASSAEALAIRRRILPAGDPMLGWTLNILGNAQFALGESSAAKASHEEALAIRRKASPKSDLDIAWSLSNLGIVQLSLGEYAAAKASHAEALTIRRKVLPKDDLDIALSLNNLGIVQHNLGEHAAAKASHAEALTIRRKILPKDDLDIAWSLTNLGVAQSALREFKAAKVSYEGALEIRRMKLAAGHPDIAHSLLELATVQTQLQDSRAAMKSVEEILTIVREPLPKENPENAARLALLGAVQNSNRDYAGARKSLESALTILRKVARPGDLTIASCLSELGNAYVGLRKYQLALKSHEEALAIRRKSLPADHRDIATSLNFVAVACMGLRDFAKARTSCEETLAIRRKARPADQAEIARGLVGLGAVQLQQTDYIAAKANVEEALAMLRKVLPAEHTDIANYLSILGIVQLELLDAMGAKASYQDALAINRKALPPEHPDIATCLNALGDVHTTLGEHEAAQAAFDEALAILRKSRPARHPDIAESLTGLGRVQWARRDLAGARKSLEEALAVRRNSLAKDDFEIAANLSYLGELQSVLRDYKAARKSIVEAADIIGKVLPRDHKANAAPLLCIGRMSLMSGEDVPRAARALAQAADIVHAEQLRLAVAQAESEQLATAALFQRCMHDLIAATLATRADPAVAYDRVVQGKGSVTAGQRWERQARELADPKTARLLDQLRQITRQIAALSMGERPSSLAPSVRPDVPAVLRALSDERARLEQQLIAHSAAHRTIRARAQVRAADIRAILPKGTALVDLVDYEHVSPQFLEFGPLEEDRIAAFVVRPQHADVAVVTLGSSHSLAAVIDRWRKTYGAGKAPPAGEPDPGVSLRKRLWEPLARHLDGVNVVLISPDGPLNGLPWAALPGSKPGAFLVHEYAFAVVPVPQLLPELLRAPARRDQDKPSLLLAGGIDFGEEKVRDPKAPSGKLPPVPTFGPLHGAESEVNDLRSYFEDSFPDAPPPKRLTKDNGTKQAVIAAAPSYRFIHLATHGFFAGESEESAIDVAQRANPLRSGFHFRPEAAGRHPGLLSGLVFAGVNRADRPPAETILTALEAAELNLDKVELVTLSACDTGRGRVAGGEGVLGLQRAFQLAGARSVLASLWKVPDEETHQLMREFYRRIWSKDPISKAEALRQAQLWMLENWKPRGTLERPAPQGRPSPYYWAAFVLSGDWR
jgi:CHAT domain-containing protein/tetratricopeptide (TPR) repeat protein